MSNPGHQSLKRLWVIFLCISLKYLRRLHLISITYENASSTVNDNDNSNENNDDDNDINVVINKLKGNQTNKQILNKYVPDKFK